MPPETLNPQSVPPGRPEITPAQAEELSAVLDWNVTVPKFDEKGEIVFFLFGDPKLLKARRALYPRAAIEAFDLVLRQFQCLRENWGVHSILQQQVAVLQGDGDPNLENHVKAFYMTSLLARGMEAFEINLALYLRTLPAELMEAEIVLSPLHEYGLLFCAEAVQNHLLRVGQQRPDWMFEEPQAIEKACQRAVEAVIGIEEKFSGKESPAQHLLTLGDLQRSQQQLQEEKNAPTPAPGS